MNNTSYQYNNLDPEDAVRIMLDSVDHKIEETESVPLSEALGRFAASACVSEISQPPFPRSPLDGYALRACDSRGASAGQPVVLRVTEEITAGDMPVRNVCAGEAVRIMTGAPIPDGADCVIRQEDTDYGERFVSIQKELKPYENYCFAGEDFKKGDCLIPEGTRITSVELGILASMGRTDVSVRRRVRVGIFSTGDELTEPGIPLAPGKIYNSNLYVLAGRMRELGMDPVITGKLPDTEQGVADGLKNILSDVDLILTTGGVSVGKKDIIHGALDLLGAEKVFWRVRIKPGTPTVFAIAENVPIVALSGNPFGALTHLELLVRPLLAKMSGDSTVSPDVRTARMADPFPKGGKMHRIVRGFCLDGNVYLPSGLHSSGVLGSLQGCNCLIDIQPGSNGLQVGDMVNILMLRKKDPIPSWM